MHTHIINTLYTYHLNNKYNLISQELSIEFDEVLSYFEKKVKFVNVANVD